MGTCEHRGQPPIAQFSYNGDGLRTSKTVAGDTTEYVLDLLATLPVVISDTDAVYLYGLAVSPPRLLSAPWFVVCAWARCEGLNPSPPTSPLSVCRFSALSRMPIAFDGIMW